MTIQSSTPRLIWASLSGSIRDEVHQNHLFEEAYGESVESYLGHWTTSRQQLVELRARMYQYIISAFLFPRHFWTTHASFHSIETIRLIPFSSRNMKTTAFLAVLCAAFTAVSASDTTCKHNGNQLDNNWVIFHTGRACTGYDGKTGKFQGTFEPGEMRHACVTFEDNKKLELWLQNQNGQKSFDVKDDDCVLEFIYLTADCGKGGYTKGGTRENAGWKFE